MWVAALVSTRQSKGFDTTASEKDALKTRKDYDALSPLQQGYVSCMFSDKPSTSMLDPIARSNPYSRWTKKHKDWQAGWDCAAKIKEAAAGKAGPDITKAITETFGVTPEALLPPSA